MQPTNFLEMVNTARSAGIPHQLSCHYLNGSGGLLRLWYCPERDTCVMGFEVQAHHADPSEHHGYTVHAYPRAEYDNRADWCDAVTTAWEELTDA